MKNHTQNLKKYLLFLILIANTITSNSQTTRDVIYLFNGDILKGNIMADTEAGIKIETSCGNVFNLEKSEIDSMGKELIPPLGQIKKSGYIAGVSIGTLAGSTINDIPYPFSIMIEQQVRFFNYFIAGGFMGFEALNEPTLPVGASVTFIIPLEKSAFFLNGKSGFGFSLEKPKTNIYYYEEIKEAKGGVLYNGEIGYMFRGSDQNSFFIALGYRYQELNYTREDYYFGNVDRTMYFNRISLRIGILFY